MMKNILKLNKGTNCSDKVNNCTLVKNCTDLNHGVCIGTNKCQCFTGYSGITCNITISCDSLSNCSGNMRLKIF